MKKNDEILPWQSRGETDSLAWPLAVHIDLIFLKGKW